jgi:Dolichyl-phosphate-mannose-protein mannosyltransferase
MSGTRIAWGVLAGLVLLHVTLAILLFDPKPFVGGDNAGYMALAESIEADQGYRDIWLPTAPLHAKYPPFYPLVLALVGSLGGGLIAFKVLSVIFTSASVIVVFLLARSRLGREGALAVAALFALNPVLLYYSHWVLSEAPFVLLTVVALWGSEHMTESPRWLALTVVAALLAYLTRAAGLPLLLGLLLAIGWRQLWRQLAVVGGIVAAGVGAWWIWGKIAAAGADRAYSSEFLLVNPYDPGMGYVGPGELLARAVNNVRLYSVEVLPQTLAGVTPGGGVNLLALLAGLLVIALALMAWVRGIRRMRVLELFVALYAALIFLWPEAWTDRRFLLPLLPALFTLAAAGVVWCFDFMRARRPVWVLPAVGALLVLLALPGHVRGVGFSQRCMRVYRQGDSLACYPAPWRAFVEAAYWVNENTAEDVIVINRKPRLFYLFSGRRGDVYPFISDDDEMLDFLEDIGADYVVVVAGLSATTFRYLVPVIRSVPDRFALEYTVGDAASPDAWVLAYLGSGGEGAGPDGVR